MVCWLHETPIQERGFGGTSSSHYNEALGRKSRGKPQLFFIARKTPSGRFAKPHKDIEYLENLLISFGVERNSDFLNSNGTRYFKQLIVPGIFNSPQGMRTNAERELKAFCRPPMTTPFEMSSGSLATTSGSFVENKI